MNLTSVLDAYGLNHQPVITAFGSGLINHTWKVVAGNKAFILQRINTDVFKDPGAIARNIRLIADYLARHHPGYLFVAPLATPDGQLLVVNPDGCFRLFPFVARSHTIDVVQTPEQAFEAAVQFGRFARHLSGMNPDVMQPSIEQFHDLSFRYRKFEMALKEAGPERLAAAQKLISQLQRHKSLVGEFEAMKGNPLFPLRVMHHDTKISNVLFDEQGRGLCVIDLDTLMPGYFISDVGDMMRTYLSPVSEEAQDMEQISVRESFFEAVEQGYLSEMGPVLTPAERAGFVFAGKCMIYMQALRFLSDYLNKDVYYGARYPGHNLVRATNQAVLLQQLAERKAKK